MKDYLNLIRVHHYIKNLLVFSALACSGLLFDLDRLQSGIMGFLAFCAVASVIYIVNDIRDFEKDRLHSQKCVRPIASGKISIKHACIVIIGLLSFAVFAVSYIDSKLSNVFLLAYLLMNIAYSFGLKDVPIIDITILVSGFIIRVLYGAFITGVVVSDWLYLTIISVSFYFALGKRRNELKQIYNEATRPVLKCYSENFLDKVMYMCLGLANSFYALWAMEKKETIYNGQFIIWTVPLVLLLSMAYSLEIEGESDGDPVEVLLHNNMLVILCLIYIVSMGLLLYV